MIRPSPEIEAIMRRWTEQIRRHNVDDLPHYLSSSDALVYVGTSDGELWRGKLVRDGISAHMAEVPDFTEDEIEIEAFENGETGWATYRSRFSFPATGAQGIHRVTAVFVLEKGSWKMIQHHISQPDSNIEKMGVEHSAIQALVEAAQQGFSLGQREGLASVMFTDIVESSTLASAMGDRAWSSLISRHFATLRQIIETHDGQFVKSLGDGTMSCFSSARQALSAARAIQTMLAQEPTEPHLSTRIGLHTGDVVQSDDDFFGTVVNKAARITALAGPGEIAVSDVTRAMIGVLPDFTFSDAAPATLKGLEGTHLIHRLD
ncbi:MAG: nuclear transport factor 2 family protein [Aestuariivita sp.]|uniref:nuclear transport factor 2 family protein n=1 Tax=Aestuariivita sp. TaxID=1872407 RepID=UPI003BAE397C